VQVVETWSQWAASGRLQHASFRQQAVQALRGLAEALHKPTDSSRMVSSDGLGYPSLSHFDVRFFSVVNMLNIVWC